MLEKIRKLRSNMAVYITSGVVCLLALFGIIVCKRYIEFHECFR